MSLAIRGLLYVAICRYISLYVELMSTYWIKISITSKWERNFQLALRVGSTNLLFDISGQKSISNMISMV